MSTGLPPPPAGDDNAAEFDTPITNSEKLEKMADPYRDQLEAMQAELIAHRHRLRRPPQNRSFFARVTGYAMPAGKPYAWQEMYCTSAGMVSFTSGLSAGTSDVGAAIELNGAAFIASGTVVRMWGTGDVDRMNFAFNMATPADGTAALAQLTGVTGTAGTCTWTYGGIRSGGTITIYNAPEWNGTSSGAIVGSPGSLGIYVSTSGTTTGGCVIKPPSGPHMVIVVFDSATNKWWMDEPNSAE